MSGEVPAHGDPFMADACEDDAENLLNRYVTRGKVFVSLLCSK